MSQTKRTVSFVSLGCPKNLVDSERLVANLLARGFRVLEKPEDAELVVVNTCGFLGSARKESVDAIKEAVALKDQGVQGVLVAGCMVGNYREELDREAPGVDRYVPFVDYDRIDQLAEDLLPQAAAPDFLVERRRVDAALTPGHYRYLKISEGCNHTCAFCVIPDIRGRHTSVPTEDLVQRARQLGERGVKELVLVAQDSTVYGSDLYGEIRLAKLLKRLDEVETLRWIRLMYAYPTEVKDDLLEALAGGRALLPYLDVPIQHASSSVLKRMRRGYGRERLDTMVQDLREKVPNVALRTTMIVGFPGETEAEFEELMDFVRASRFDRLGAFVWSPEEGSRAMDLPDHVPAELRQERWHRLMALQAEIAAADTAARIGQTETVLIDANPEGADTALARTWRDAPEVDANLHIEDCDLETGAMAEVEIIGASGYDLRARLKPNTDFAV